MEIIFLYSNTIVIILWIIGRKFSRYIETSWENNVGKERSLFLDKPTYITIIQDLVHWGFISFIGVKFLYATFLEVIKIINSLLNL